MRHAELLLFARAMCGSAVYAVTSCLSVCHDQVLCQNGWSYRRNLFIAWRHRPNVLVFWG